jgi:hypothetical protein
MLSTLFFIKKFQKLLKRHTFPLSNKSIFFIKLLRKISIVYKIVEKILDTEKKCLEILDLEIKYLCNDS